ncbi:MAG: nuclease-related domain-containing protein, partial [Salinivirgaceae bacterium]
GTWSERDLVLKLLKYGIPAQMIFHDLYLKKNNGDFSQIDLVAITHVGIIVFEVKDYSGWIYGNGNQSHWTQVLAYGNEKYRFYNPIMQNNNHIKELRNKINHFNNVPFYSIILFYGDCVLKDVSFIPHGTFLVKAKRVLEVIEIITKTNDPILYQDKHEIVKVLNEAVENGDYVENQIKHIENIKDMLGTNRIFE